MHNISCVWQKKLKEHMMDKVAAKRGLFTDLGQNLVRGQYSVDGVAKCMLDNTVLFSIEQESVAGGVVVFPAAFRSTTGIAGTLPASWCNHGDSGGPHDHLRHLQLQESGQPIILWKRSFTAVMGT